MIDFLNIKYRFGNAWPIYLNRVQIVLTIMVLVGCRYNNIDAPADFSGKPYYEEYHMLLDNLDQEFPGRGLDYFNEAVKDRPMAYGLILSSESNRYFHTRDNSALEMARVCGQWLLDHSDINGNGIHGYGLADDWDAFQDGTTNLENQEYTITTAIAIAGLLDWLDIESDLTKKAIIKQTVLKCMLPFLDSSFDSPIGIPVYSLNHNDLEYDVFNPAVYLAGQMQRFSQIVEDQTIKDTLASRSKAIIKVLLGNALSDQSGNLYWLYGIQYARANDLVHACYIIEGLRDYKSYGGAIDVDWNKLFDHLYLFKSNNRWYEWNRPELQNDEYNSRLWAIGMLIYTLSKEGEFAEIEDNLINQLDDYHLGNGHFKFKTDNDRLMVRQDAHLLLGLSYYLYN